MADATSTTLVEPDDVILSRDGRFAVHLFSFADEALLIPVRVPGGRVVLNADRDAGAACSLLERMAERAASRCWPVPDPLAVLAARGRRRVVVARYWPDPLRPHLSPSCRLASIAGRRECA